MAHVPYALGSEPPIPPCAPVPFGREDFKTAVMMRDFFKFCRQMGAIQREANANFSTVNKDSSQAICKDNYAFLEYVDVHHFAPQDIIVTVDNEGYVVIKGQHKEKKDEHGFIGRQFIRRYALPGDCDMDTIDCKLSSDGVLIVMAEKASPVSNQRPVPISQIGPVRKEMRLERPAQKTSEPVEDIFDATGATDK